MGKARWVEGRVFVEDTVSMARQASGDTLRDTFMAAIPTLTLGLVRARERSLWFGPVELLRFGSPRTTETTVEWPIEGGWVVGRPGGTLGLRAEPDRLVVSVSGYRPMLPFPLYSITQLPVHHLVTRLYMLRIRGRIPPPRPAAAKQDRQRAAAIDIGFCTALAVLTGRRHRIGKLIGITAAYHLACWSTSGRTLGGLVMNQRVVAVDGSRVTVAQALLRLGAVPIALLHARPEHDTIACTDVVEG